MSKNKTTNINGAILNDGAIIDIINLQEDDNACTKEIIKDIDLVQRLLFKSYFEEDLKVSEKEYKNLTYTMFAMKDRYSNLMV